VATVEAHYQNLLSEIYAWMLGGFEVQITKNQHFFQSHKMQPKGSGIAIDLGAACGFQSIPLSMMGYCVTAIDLDKNLLQQLKTNDTTGKVTAIRDDMLNFDSHVSAAAELVVCMTDTLLHLESRDRVKELFNKVAKCLEPSGKFVLTFRDLSHALEGLDRFIPLKRDDNTILTCFLEYESETVKVHDLVYRRNQAEWALSKSSYRKLRLPADWVQKRLFKAGFSEVDVVIKEGLVTVIAGV